MDAVPSVPQIVRAALADALALVLPVSCAGCDEPDVALCAACRAALAPCPVRRETAGAGSLPVGGGLAFEGVAARVMRALKEDGRLSLARQLAPALTAAVARAGGGDALLVPVPTSRASFRRRGFRVPDLIAARAGLSVTRALRPVRRVADQRGLGRLERRGNVAGSLVARGVHGVRVVVFDDVVTTGATLDEAVRALRAAGADVVGAVAVAATPRRTPFTGRIAVTSETHR
ncbi:phosphoribosyltransferase family protein [Microbacterium sp. 2FI]|uniref:ComF family protein n=1 Tax=Microbacterium sp. 2FI TaxID=2502193 RepID=UPI0010F7DAB5|nr:phosphoribosyltransferase family protein [Microbacterium sp. 2FI]